MSWQDRVIAHEPMTPEEARQCQIAFDESHCKVCGLPMAGQDGAQVLNTETKAIEYFHLTCVEIEE